MIAGKWVSADGSPSEKWGPAPAETELRRAGIEGPERPPRATPVRTHSPGCGVQPQWWEPYAASCRAKPRAAEGPATEQGRVPCPVGGQDAASPCHPSPSAWPPRVWLASACDVHRFPRPSRLTRPVSPVLGTEVGAEGPGGPASSELAQEAECLSVAPRVPGGQPDRVRFRGSSASPGDRGDHAR